MNKDELTTIEQNLIGFTHLKTHGIQPPGNIQGETQRNTQIRPCPTFRWYFHANAGLYKHRSHKLQCETQWETEKALLPTRTRKPCR